MRFAQLKTAAALAAVAALAAGLSVGLAAGPAGEAPSPAAPAALRLASAPAALDDKKKPEPDPEARELKALQGKWRALKLDADGKDAPAEQLVKFRMTVEGDIMQPENSDPNKDERLKIKLAPGKVPKQIDLTALGGPQAVKGQTTPGIYKLDGDVLTICNGKFGGTDASRPKEFKAADGATLIVLERVKDEKGELEALAGEWTGVAANVFGKELPADEVGKTKMVVTGTDVLTIGVGGAREKATLKLDPAAVPPTIDLTSVGGNQEGTVHRGIYFRAGDKLVLAFRDLKAKKDDRPADLKPGDGVDFVVLERKPKP